MSRRLAGVTTGREAGGGVAGGWLWGAGTPSRGNLRTDTYDLGMELGSGARKERCGSGRAGGRRGPGKEKERLTGYGRCTGYQ